MPRVICEFCSKPLVAPMELVGKQVPCPNCKQVIRIMPGTLNLPTDIPGTGFSDRMHLGGS